MDRHDRIVLASRPKGPPTAENFRLEQASLPTPGPGQVTVRVIWLSLDPYMRGRMDDAKSYAAPVQIGEVMEGGAVGEILTSNAPISPPETSSSVASAGPKPQWQRPQPCAKSIPALPRSPPRSACWACRATPPGSA